MPVIPQYQRKVGEADAPSVRSPMNHSADEFGAPVAKAMGQLGAVAEDISVKMDRAAVVQAENYLRTKTTEALYGENGILKRKGAAAANADKDFDKNYETILAETRKGLSGRAARSFELLAGQYKSQLFPSIQGHIAKQAEVAQDEALAGQEYADTMEMANKWRDRNAVAVMLTKGEAAVRARYAGHDPAFVAAEVQKRNSKVLRARAEALYKEGQTDDLREYLGLYEKYMDPNDVAGWKGWIKQKDETRQSFFSVQEMKSNPAFRDADGRLDLAKGIQAIQDRFMRGGSGITVESLQKEGAKYKGLTYEMDNEPGHMDCSLFTQKVYGAHGVELPRTADYQYKYFEDKGQIQTDKSNLKPGDIVFFKNTYDDPDAYKNVTHVAIYMGNGKIMQSGRQSGVGAVIDVNTDKIAGFAHVGPGGAPDPDKMNRELSLWRAEVALDHEQDRERKNQTLNSMFADLAQTKPDSTAALVSLVSKYYPDGTPDFVKAVSAATQYMSIGKVHTNPEALSAAYRELDQGTPYATVRLRYSESISDKDFRAMESYDGKIVKGMTGGVISDMLTKNKLNNTPAEAIIREKVMADVQAWQEDPKNVGKRITASDLQEIVGRQLTKVVLVKGFLSDTKGRLGQIPGWMQIDDVSPYVEVGGVKYRPTRYDKNTGSYYTTISGKEVDMNQLRNAR